MWQAQALLARIRREGGDPAGADAAWSDVLARDPANATARLARADLAMNEFGDPQAAIALVAPLRGSASHGADAELTELMARLYVGGDARTLSARLAAFSRSQLRLPRLPSRAPRAGRRRVGLISPLFSASPVYYLTASTWTQVAQQHDLVFFNRGTKADWATERLRGLAREWIEVAHVPSDALAARIAAAEIDVLFDLGGWSDAEALKALSAKPAARLYTWVGGQSATTGLEMFDGWIGDEWQSPASAQPLYAEPLIETAGGYIDYTPPAILAALRDGARRGVALVGNPAKIGTGTITAWPNGVERVTLIDRRYAHERVRARVTTMLAEAGIAVAEIIVPEGQEAYLRALARHDAIVNTQPYAAGLTAVEAHALGMTVLSSPDAGALFCSRHHLSHRRTLGRNRALAPQLLALIAR